MRARCLTHASVTIRVNGQVLTEHSTQDDGSSISTFVEAVAGAKFAVVLQLSNAFTNTWRDPRDQINFGVYVDGEWAAGLIVQPKDKSHNKSTLDSALETENNRTTRRNFIFARHETSDDQAHTPLTKNLADIGTITVKLTRCRNDGEDRAVLYQTTFKGVGDAKIPEKALKGRSISNHVKLGPSYAAPNLHWPKVTYPHGSAPLATYMFQYRSRRDLEIEGILEREASPVPLEDRDPEELTPDELREQVRLLRAKQAAVEIKQENMPQKRKRERSPTLGNDEGHDDDDDEGDVTITSTSDRRKRARASMEGAETIDLTED